MNKNTKVEITYPSNFCWEHSMSVLGLTEGMTEEELTAKIADFVNSDDIDVNYIPETNTLSIYVA